jgi:hypothetical protein
MDEKRFAELRELRRRGEMRNFTTLADLGEFSNLLCDRLDSSESKLDMSETAVAECHGEINRLESKLDRCVAALNSIACWGEGPTVGGHFDEPHSAEIARAALAPLPEAPK